MIVWFGGGIGNQLFQYALYTMACYKGFDTKADLSLYNNYGLHNGFELEKVFGIKLNEGTKEEIYKYRNRNNLVARLIRKVGFSSFGISRNIIKEQKAQFIPDLLASRNENCYLLGYWQSEQYFKNASDYIKERLIFPELNNRNKLTCDNIQNSLSVSIHIRRGDYLKSENLKMFNNLGDTRYYEKAIMYFNNKFENIKYFVFSDDIQWCKYNLKLSSNTVYVDWNKGTDSYIDMQLMSQCKHNIIANSSFSWWGAYLNNNKNKIIVAPENWFSKKSGYDDRMILPIEWNKISC